jgi:DNA-binding transcriptional LysR family regulator
VLKVSLAPTFGIDHVLPLLPEFLARYPLIRLEWHFENRQVDLIAEGYDAAIGGGFELTPGVVSRTLAAADVVAVASPAYMAGRTLPSSPADLAQYNGIVMRGIRTGRVRQWVMRDSVGNEASAELSENIVLNDPAAMREAALLGLGVTLLVSPDVIAHIQHGELLRLLPDWHADAGSISLYYPSRTLMPAKTRVFIDYLVEAFERG